MARLPRLTVPGYVHHVIQRGNNHQPIFRDNQDRELMLALFAEYAPACRVSVHAYVVMDDHIHLLATPEAIESLPRLMQSVGRRYVRHFNDRYRRSGTLWDGRYRATVLEASSYLLACMVYIDLNPVRAGAVLNARDYPWSSHAHYIGLRQDRLMTPHPLWWTLGNTPFAREAAYADLVNAGLSAEQQRALTDATLHGWVLGSEVFAAQLQSHTLRRTTPRKPGRPPKSSSPI